MLLIVSLLLTFHDRFLYIIYICVCTREYYLHASLLLLRSVSVFFNTATSYPLVPSMFYRRNNEVGFRDRVVDVDDDDD